MNIKNNLNQSVIGNGLDNSELERLAGIARVEQFYKNEIIFAENDEGDSIYVLVEGKVCLERRVKNHRPVPPTQITIVRQGQLFGEMGFLENRKRSATARAKGNIQLLVIDSEDLRKLISSNSQFAIKFMSNLALILSARLRRMNEQWLNAISRDFQLPEFEYF